jgi:glyoxylase-like metal-dependent hydrolase (beta-lactamase superfamily II)
MGSPRDENEVRIQGLPPDVVALPGFHAVDIAGVFKDGDIFEVGETSFTAIHTPGHSPGHYAFFFPKESILFSADLDISPLGPWYGGHYCDLDELIQSIHKLIALKPQVLVSSHRRVLYSEIDDLMHAYLNIALQREEKILSYLCEPRTICDIADQGFINEWNQRSLRSQRTLFWHKMMIDKHLQRLQKLGLIARTPENKYICI